MIPKESVLDLSLLTKIASREYQFDGLFVLEQSLNYADCSVAIPLPSLNFPNFMAVFLNKFTASFATKALIAKRVLRDINRLIQATRPCPRPSPKFLPQTRPLQLPAPGLVALGITNL
jgi:hypothetical protein